MISRFQFLCPKIPLPADLLLAEAPNHGSKGALRIPPKRCDPPGVLDSPIGSRENLQTLQETNWRVESMVSCKFPLNQTMRIINLLRMLRVQPYNYLKSLTNVLLFVPLAQEIIKKIGEAGFNEASNGAVSSCWLCRVTGCNCNTTGWV